MTPEGQALLDALLAEAARDGLFPQARAVVRSGGTVVYDGGIAAGPDTVFDLASLTKVLGTTAAFLALWAGARVAPGMPIRDLLPDARVAEAGVTLGDLLYHRSGLPAFVPYFADALRQTPALLDPACRADVRVAARRRVVARALATPLATAPGQEAVYSDVGFILLGEALAAAARRPLDTLVQGRVVAPLGLGCHFRRPAAPGRRPDLAAMAPTGRTRPREPAPGQEGLWSGLPSAPAIAGEVDDDNAWVMDGVAGHAGLFGTAADVAGFGQAVLDDLAGAGRLAPAHLWQEAVSRDRVTPGSTRGLGFDTVEPEDPPGSSAGASLGRLPPGPPATWGSPGSACGSTEAAGSWSSSAPTGWPGAARRCVSATSGPASTTRSWPTFDG